MALHKTVEEVSLMSSKELSAWLAYDRIEPLYDPWLAHGIQCATIANLWSKERHKPADFIPGKRKKKTAKQMFSQLKAGAIRGPSGNNKLD